MEPPFNLGSHGDVRRCQRHGLAGSRRNQKSLGVVPHPTPWHPMPEHTASVRSLGATTLVFAQVLSLSGTERVREKERCRKHERRTLVTLIALLRGHK